MRSFSTFCGFVIGIQAAKHTSNRKTDKLPEQKGRGAEREVGRGPAANNRRWSVLLKQFRRIYFWPQKRNAEQSGLTTIKVMLTNNPRRDWEGLTAAEAARETERETKKEGGVREKCHRRTKS